jgi:hypothetical protein
MSKLLSGRLLEVVQAMELCDCNPTKVAVMLGISENTVRGHLGIAKFRTKMNPLDPTKIHQIIAMADDELMHEKRCPICGEIFYTPNDRLRICSDVCRGRAKRETVARCREGQAGYEKIMEKPKKKKTKQKVMSLEDAVRNANAMGMSYGQYMTWLRERA